MYSFNLKIGIGLVVRRSRRDRFPGPDFLAIPEVAGSIPVEPGFRMGARHVAGVGDMPQLYLALGYRQVRRWASVITAK